MTHAAPSFGWGHININVSNLEQSIAFYEKLGFSKFIPAIPYLGLSADAQATTLPKSSACALDVPTGTQGRACIMQLDNGFPKLDLTEFTGNKQNSPLVNADLGLVRICLVSQNLQRDYASLTEQGVKFLSPVQSDKARLADVAVCVDPDGTLIELLQVYLENWPRLDISQEKNQ